MAQSSIAGIESGDRAIRLNEAAAIANALDLPLSALLSESDVTADQRAHFAAELTALEESIRDLRKQRTRLDDEVESREAELRYLRRNGPGSVLGLTDARSPNRRRK